MCARWCSSVSGLAVSHLCLQAQDDEAPADASLDDGLAGTAAAALPASRGEVLSMARAFRARAGSEGRAGELTG